MSELWFIDFEKALDFIDDMQLPYTMKQDRDFTYIVQFFI